ncbi:hypothetical protein M433DRAFT_159569 [Acidomyces richmondensis BFW]|nr:MAG: hypothetical protein FE78DRAFT_87789 [Acidomyces sp. 'richmondensis']KYG41009.1 hypothetical protein M433DRAFT_159569 [Acidomyces richmondensis BFW]
MTKTSRGIANATEESFHKHYAAIWGEERWRISLYPALAEGTRYIALVNRYASVSDFKQAINDAGIPSEELQQIHFPSLDPIKNPSQAEDILCFARVTQRIGEDGKLNTAPSNLPFPPPAAANIHRSKLMTHWNLDAASVLVVHLLDIKPGESVLDLCAAPGGKSVALAQKMWPALQTHDSNALSTVHTQSMGRIVSNEVDGNRQKRLEDNLHAYFPPLLFKENFFQCTNVDGTNNLATNKLQAKHGYDKVLVDAPCSSERHIIHAQNKAKASGNAAKEMSSWRPNTAKRIASTQLQLLMNALKLTKIGGKIIYATCSIETNENDGVIEKMMSQVRKDRRKGLTWDVNLGFESVGGEQLLETQVSKWAEKTAYGWIVLPDHPSNGKWGPLYFSIITKCRAPTRNG